MLPHSKMQQINNLSGRLFHNKEQIKAALDRVITSGWLILGPEVKRFEQNFSTYLDAKYCVGLANGTDAIELALKAMEINAGDLVATVANAGMYTTTALMAIGANPFFMDVDIDTKVTTFEEVKKAVEAGAKAVVVTHLYGCAISEISQIAAYCAQNKIPLLEDCAQAHGAKINNQYVGTFGDAASFSFYPTKNLGALGDAGAVVTNSQELAEKVRMLRQYGWAEKYKVVLACARNSRLDELQAAILSEFLPSLNDMNVRRREIASRYSTYLCHPKVITPKKSGDDYIAHLYVIRSQQRNALQEFLRSKHIETAVHYPIPDYRQPIFKNRFTAVHLPITERLANEILTLPCYPEMSDQEADNVITAINAWSI